MIRDVYEKFRHRCEVIRVKKLRSKCALKLVSFLKSICKLRGPNREVRDNRQMRSALTLNNVMTMDLQEQKATQTLREFFTTYSGRLTLENKIRVITPYLNTWKAKA